MPVTWNAPGWETNAAEALALRAKIGALCNGEGSRMRQAENGTATIDVMTLNGLMDDGTPSIRSVMSPAFQSVVEDSFAEFAALVAAGPQTLIDGNGAWAGGTAGGIDGTSYRGMNKGGVEVRQVVDKALFAGAAMYAYAANLTAGTITPATVDAISAAWGSNATLDPMGTRTMSAGYAFSEGLFASTAQSLAEARAYAADANCNAERDEAIRQVFRKWELAQVARVIFYNTSSQARLAMGTPNDKIEALHALAEGVGLVWGFRGLENPATGPLSSGVRVMTDADVDAVLAALRINRTNLEESTMGTFVTSGLAEGAAAADAALKDALDLTDAQVTAFRAPTAG